MVKCWGDNDKGQVMLFFLLEDTLISCALIVSEVTVCFCADWRRHTKSAKNACSSCRFGRRSGGDCFGRSTIIYNVCLRGHDSLK